jgi:hypothetical protein
MEFCSQSDPFERVTLALCPDRYQSGLVAWRQRTATPIREAVGSISRRGVARRLNPGR